MEIKEGSGIRLGSVGPNILGLDRVMTRVVIKHNNKLFKSIYRVGVLESGPGRLAQKLTELDPGLNTVGYPAFHGGNYSLHYHLLF